MEKNVYRRQNKENKNHWWFEAKKNIIFSILKTHIKSKNLKILDFGCGVGVNTLMLSNFGHVTCFDQNPEAVKYVKKKFDNRKEISVRENLENCDGLFDVVIASEVIEHIEDDEKAIKEIYSFLKPEGFFLATVPAYQFLFSKKDIQLHHKRRYTLPNFNKLLKPFFSKIKISYFNFFLSLPIFFAILFLKMLKNDFTNSVEKKPNKLLNYICYKIFLCECYFVNKINFPFGISIVFLGKKK